MGIREDEEERAVDLRRQLAARIAEVDRQERAALGLPQVDPQQEEHAEEEVPLFDDDGVLDPGFVEVRTREYHTVDGYNVWTGRYIRSYRRRRSEDGTDAVVYARPRLK